MGPKRSRASVSTKSRDILTPEMADRRGGSPSPDTNIFTMSLNYKDIAVAAIRIFGALKVDLVANNGKPYKTGASEERNTKTSKPQKRQVWRIAGYIFF